MPSIDERVVRMQMDNQQFESKASQSMQTLDKLKQKLNFKGAEKGVENIQKASEKVDFKKMSDGIENINQKFSALGVFTTTLFARMSNAAISFGKTLVKSISIDQVVQGYQEYETQMNSIQTILANTKSKGSTLEDVNKALDEMNTYADKTIYNFSEMAKNVGTFTAAGVGLQDSVNAIKGIANLAAVSGSNSQKASMAMYQLSQAIAAGRVNLQDWNSVVNAGMGGEVFQHALERTGKAMGKLSQSQFDDLWNGKVNFRETIGSHGDGTKWLDSKILVETLNQISGAYDEATLKAKGYSDQEVADILDLAKTAEEAATKVKTFTQLVQTIKEAIGSGWAMSFRIVIGDFEEARTMYTQINNVISDYVNKTATARNDMLRAWKELGGRTKLLEALKNAFYGILSVVKPIKEAMQDVFPPMTAERLYAMTEAFGKFTEKMKVADSTAQNIKRTFRGVFAVFDIFGQAISAVVKGIASLIGYFAPAGSGLLDLSGGLGDVIYNFDQFLKKNDIFGKAVMKVVQFIEKCIDKVKELAAAFKKGFKIPGLDTVSKGLGDVSEKLGNLKVSFKGIKFPKISAALDKMFEGLKSGIEGFGKFFTEDIPNWFKDVAKGMGLMDKEFSGFKLGLGIQKLFNGGFKAGLDGFIAFLRGVGDAMQKFDPDQLISFISGLTVMVTKATMLGSLASIFTSGGSLLVNLKNIVAIAKDALSSYKSKGDGILDSLKKTITKFGKGNTVNDILKISVAVGILAASLIGIASLKPEKLAGGLIGIGGVLAMLKAFMMSIDSTVTDPKKLSKMTTFMLMLAISVKIMSNALKEAGALGMKGVVAGLIGIGGIMAGITAMFVVFDKCLGKKKKLVGGAMAMIFAAAAVRIMAKALKEIGMMDIGGIARGLLGIGGVLGALTAVFVILSRFSSSFDNMNNGMALLTAANAIKKIGAAITEISKLSLGGVAKAILGIGSVLGALTGMFVLMSRFSSSTKNIGNGVAMIAVAAAMKTFAGIMQQIGAMDMASIGKSILGITSVLGTMTTMFILLKQFGGGASSIASGASFIMVAISMRTFAGIMQDIGKMSLDGVGRALLGIAGTLGAVTAALNLMPKASQSIGKSAALVILSFALKSIGNTVQSLGGMSWSGVAKGLITFGGSLVILAIALNAMKKAAAGAAALTIASVGIKILASALKAISGISWSGLLKGLAGLGGSLAVLGVAINLFSKFAVKGLIFAGVIAAIGAGLFILGAGLTSLGAGLATTGAGMVSFTAGIAANLAMIPLTVQTVIETLKVNMTGIIDLIKSFIMGILDTIIAVAPALGQAIVAVIEGLVPVLTEAIPDLVEGLVQMVYKVLDALVQYVPGIVAKLVTLVSEILNALADHAPEFVSAISNFLGKMFGALMDEVENLNPDTFLKMTESLGIFELCLAGAAALKPFIKPAMAGLLGVGVCLAEMTGILAALGALNKIPGLQEFVQSGGDLLQAIGTAIGQFVGGIIGGIGIGVTADMITIADNLSQFMVHLQPFLIMANTVPEGVASTVGELAKALLIITGADLLLSLKNFVTPFQTICDKITGNNQFTRFADGIRVIGPAIKDFGDSIKGIDSSAVKNSAQAGEALAKMATLIPNEGGLVSLFTGDNDMAKFAEKLTPFGTALKDYGDAVKGIDAKSIEDSAAAGTALAKMAIELPNDGGVVSWFTGDNDLGEFAEKLEPFGEGLKKYGDAVKGIDPEAIEESAKAATAVVNMAKEIPNSGGVVSWFTGDNDLSDFADGLYWFGSAIKGFSEQIVGIDNQLITATANSGMALSELANSLPNTLPAVDKALNGGQMTMEEFSEQIVKFGEGIATYSEKVIGIDPKAVTSSITAGKALAALANNLPSNTGNIKKAFSTSQMSLSDFGLELESFATSMVNYAQTLDDPSFDLDTIKSKTTTLADTLKSFSGVQFETGLFKLVADGGSFSGMGNDLGELAAGMKTYSDNLADATFDDTIVDKSGKIASIMTELSGANTFEDGGVLGWLTGHKENIDDVGRDLASFALKMGEYATNVNEAALNDTTIEKTGLFADIMQTLSGKTNQISDFVTMTTTKLSGVDLGSELSKVANGMTEYANAVNGTTLDDTTVEKTGSIQSCLNKLYWGFKNIVSIDADKAIDIIDRFPDIGTDINDLNTNMGDVTTEDIQTVKDNIDKLAECFKDFGTDQTIVDNFANALRNLADNGVSKFTNKFKDSVPTVETAVTQFINKATTTINESNAATTFGDAGKDLVDKFVTGFQNEYTAMESTITDLVAKVKDAFSEDDDSTSSAKTAGKSLAQKFIDAIRDQKESARLVGLGTCNSALTGLSTNLYQAITWGQHFGQNFADGIKSKIGEVRRASNEMGGAAADPVHFTVPKVGPLKDEDKWGGHMVDNFANAMEKNIPKVSKASKNLAWAAARYLKHSTPQDGPLKDDDKWGTHMAQNISRGMDEASGDVKQSALNLANQVYAGVKTTTTKSGKIVNRDMDDIAKDIVSNASKVLKSEKQRRKVSYQEEVLFWNNIMDKVKGSAESIKDAETDLNDAIYEGAEDLINERKEQMGDQLTDEAAFWQRVIQITSEGSSAQLKAIKAYNEAVISDTENAITMRHEIYGDNQTDDYDYWAAAYENNVGDPRISEKTLHTIDRNLNSSFVSDAEHQLEKLTKVQGEYGAWQYSYWQDQAAEAERLGLWPSTIESIMDKSYEGYLSDVQRRVDEMTNVGKSAKEITDYLFEANLNAPAELSYEQKQTLNNQWQESTRNIVSEAQTTLDDVTKIHELSNTEQALYWKSVMDTLQSNTEGYSEAEQKFLDARKQAWDEYANAVSQTQQKLASELSLTSEFKFNESGFNLFENTENERSALDSYNEQMEALEQRDILSQDTLDYIKQNVSIADSWMIQQLATGSDAALERFEENRQYINEQTQRTAEEFNKSLKPDILYTEEDAQAAVASVATVYAAIVGEADNPVYLESLNNSLKAMNDSATAQSTNNAKSFESVGATMMDSTIKAIALHSQGVADACASAVRAAIAAAQAAAGGAQSAGSSVGTNIGKGVTTGMGSQTVSVAASGIALGNAAVNGVRTATNTHSPSRVMMEIGGYLAQGLALGMSESTDTVTKQSSDLGLAIVNTLNGIIDPDADISPVISPVVDLSNVQQSATAVDSMFSHDETMRVAADFDTYKRSADARTDAAVKAGDDNSIGSINVSIYSAPGQNPDDISDAVIRKLNNEIIRKGKVFA